MILLICLFHMNTHISFILDLINIRTAYFHKADICTHNNKLIGTKKFVESTQCAIHCLNNPLCGSFILSSTKKRYKCDMFTRAIVYPLSDCELTENLFEGRSCINVEQWMLPFSVLTIMMPHGVKVNKYHD